MSDVTCIHKEIGGGMGRLSRLPDRKVNVSINKFIELMARNALLQLNTINVLLSNAPLNLFGPCILNILTQVLSNFRQISRIKTLFKSNKLVKTAQHELINGI